MLRGGLHRAAFLSGEGQKRGRRCMRRLLPGNGTENAARCTGPRSTLHEPSQRAASAIAPHCTSQASSDEGKQQSKGAIRPPRWTSSRPPLCPKQGAPAEALHQFIQKQEPRCLIRSTAVFYFKEAVPSSATARLPHRHPTFGTSMKLSSTHILPHSPSERSTVHDPKCRFCNQAVAQFLTRNTAFVIRAQRVLQGEQALCLTPPGTKG